jgi:hypothetical protein
LLSLVAEYFILQFAFRKKAKIKIHVTVILLLVCATAKVVSGIKLRMFENVVFRLIFGSKEEEIKLVEKSA